MGEHYGLIKDVGFLGTECKNVWLEIREINKRQITLRENLPKDYVNRNDLEDIKSRLKSIDEKLDNYRFIRGTT
jgi:DNA integrity scanning protein DisA with diadenylate cyclase activity